MGNRLMLDWLDYLRQLNIWSMMLRVLCAMAAGGLVGFERERKGRPAGFRTYMLVALGAALTIMLSQYFNLMFEGPWKETGDSLGIKTDVSRLGAQVINGVGFLGAGTIIVTGRREVKGLTTAAGLWASACVGLAVGIGFYEAAVIACVVIFCAERLLWDFGHKQNSRDRTLELFLSLRDSAALGDVISALQKEQIKVEDLDFVKKEIAGDPAVTVIVTVCCFTPREAGGVAAMLRELDGVVRAEDL